MPRHPNIATDLDRSGSFLHLGLMRKKVMTRVWVPLERREAGQWRAEGLSLAQGWRAASPDIEVSV
jgi:hypothetical protein